MDHLYLGTAGWSLRREHFSLFPECGTYLQRYASRFNAVEINSSFYRPHRFTTYQRWADSTPDAFAFSVKLPKEITHSLRLRNADERIENFLGGVSGLGRKFGVLLVQLPPSLAFDSATAHSFFSTLRSRIATPIVCEPRHATWFTTEAVALLDEQQVSHVSADPNADGCGSQHAGPSQCAYFRWHGSPRIYYSKYDAQHLQLLAEQVLLAGTTAKSVWCIFDNTAEGAATENALETSDLLRAQRQAVVSAHR